ncbi:hypothetical protein PHSY_004731 [Pseudozyma hubeiensis SY62]|uniref:BTB domain-containing protein n=1 Tax=Pseudozyma hubeiensis (strain SY62) TaxID=1305764 RepID=R9P707_PSEHS|nr:hypothetical protein PHSY_004731 [Pseudozyma hubeiensis SY62]GAC97146.1 hypothetical protein PHSY_004731 [Pseudozyma hubeiensis SY62]
MQSHIYELGLLGGRCSDIRIKAFGRLYHLHRLVLIQSGFFRAMLCGGYAEDLAAASAAATLSKHNSHRETQTSFSPLHTTSSTSLNNDVVELHFDDPNISRAAFEYCIARLYGDGPKLVLPFWSSPTSEHPFSLALAMRLSPPTDTKMQTLLIDKRSHPATPRFLLSLLATSIYLNIPSVTAQALTLVLCSMTPFTVTQYLRFAIGCGIEGTDLHRSASDEMLHDLEEWDWELEGPARTLEQIARLDPELGTSTRSRPSNDQTPGHKAEASDQFSTEFFGKLHVASPSASRETSQSRSGQATRTPWLDTRSQATSLDDKRGARKTAGFSEVEPAGSAMRAVESVAPEYQYGITADKIGEACVCWFARWGLDIFELECSTERERIIEIETWISMCREDRDVARLALLRDRLHTGDVDLLHTSMLPRGRMPDAEERMPSPRLRVWSYPSMPSAWVRAIISSDGFFVTSELQRYEFAKKVVEFRRKQKALINVLDRLIDGWMHEDEAKDVQRHASASESSKQMGAAPKTSSSSAASSDAGDGFGFKAFRRTTSSVDGGDDADPTRTPLQEAWDDGVESTTFSGSMDEDETEYEELFTSGIYYSHMPFQALNQISTDVSPTTGRSYTPLNVLQAALWVSNELKTHILSSATPIRQGTTPTPHHDADTASEVASYESSDPSAQDRDGATELGVSSSITQFREAFESSINNAGSSQRRFSRSRSGTPGYFGDDSDPTLGLGSTPGLGGLGTSPLMLGALGGGKEGLLSKKFYLVPSDDTVRFGDGLTSVIGSVASSVSGASRAAGSDDERAQIPAAFVDDHLGPSGIAAIQIPHTLPIQTVMHHDPANASSQRRDRSRYYGIANDVATGRELGEYAYRNMSPTPDTSPHGAKSSMQSRPFEENDDRRPITGESDTNSHSPSQEADGADAESIDSTGASPEQWSGYEPMRVGVEFFGIDKLQEKQRLYSPTFFYAGSCWNLYIQVVKKVKGVQLGIYLHRQSLQEPLPPPSAPAPVEGEAVHGLTPEASWPRSSPGARATLQRDLTNGSATPRGSGGGFSWRAERAAQPSSALRSSVLAATAGDDIVGGDTNGSFFDTSLTSPVRAGGHGNETGSGSTMTLPSGRSITRMGGYAGGSPMRGGGNRHDVFSSTNQSELSTQAEGSENTMTSLPALSTLADLSLTQNYVPNSTSSRNTQSSSMTASTNPIIQLYPSGPSVYTTCPVPPIPYRDPRKELRAYFSIHCPSPLGTALTKFSSGPDKFTISQSWGWKSSSLLGTVYLEDGDLDKGKSGLWYRFRCVCSIGLV